MTFSVVKLPDGVKQFCKLTNWQWFDVVCTLNDNNICNDSGQNDVVSWSAAE